IGDDIAGNIVAKILTPLGQLLPAEAAALAPEAQLLGGDAVDFGSPLVRAAVPAGTARGDQIETVSTEAPEPLCHADTIHRQNQLITPLWRHRRGVRAALARVGLRPLHRRWEDREATLGHRRPHIRSNYYGTPRHTWPQPD